MKEGRPETTLVHPSTTVQAGDDDARIAEMQATGRFAGMEHISTLIEAELERLLAKVAGGGDE